MRSSQVEAQILKKSPCSGFKNYTVSIPEAVISQNFWQLLLPSEPPSEAMIPLPSSTLADLESLSVGVLVQVREGAPPLALLAAGERAGLQPSL
jgi:hypothetical protein